MHKSTIKKKKDMVVFCLREFEETRNSDITLLIKVWEEFYPQRIKTGKGGERGVWLRDLYDLPREEHVRRIRAVIQNEEGKYLPTDPAVRKQRRINEDVWREWLGYAS